MLDLFDDNLTREDILADYLSFHAGNEDTAQVELGYRILERMLDIAEANGEPYWLIALDYMMEGEWDD